MITSEADKLFGLAQRGSDSSLGRLMNLYTNYLKLLLTAQLDGRLRARISPSDVVQETFFEAHRDFHQFRGQSTGEFIAWLRRILINNLLRVVEQHLIAEKRDVRREVSLERMRTGIDQSTVRLESLLAASGASPSADAQRRERELQLADALTVLPPDYRDVIVLRHIEGLSFDDIALRMERTSGAVRMLWVRAIRQLRDNMQEEPV
jgi:RNA polymerase sigma-70 factor (ECF subfamily)